MQKNDKQKKNEKLKLSDLPPELREKYKNHSLFLNEMKKKPKLELTQQQLNELKLKKQLKEKSIEERLEEEKITTTQEKALSRVFDLFCSYNLENSVDNSKSKKAEKVVEKTFKAQHIAHLLQLMGMTLTKSEVDLMLWEVDENLDAKVTKNEFFNMYKRCIMKDSDLEPRSLFHMVQFLMYCNPDRYNQPPYKFTITVEDTLELLYVRHGRDQLDIEIKAIFGEDDKPNDGQEKEITFAEYLDKINQRAIKQRKLNILKRKAELSFKKFPELEELKNRD